MRSVGLFVSVAALCAGFAESADAQLLAGITISAEVRPALGSATGAFAGSDEGVGAGGGAGVSAGGSLGAGPVGVYGEYQLMSFSCADCEATGLDDRVEDRGWEAGAELRVPLAPMGLRPWVRGGVLGHQLRISGVGSSIVSEPTLGWGAGAGVVIPLPAFFEASPAVRYRSYTAEYRFEQIELPSRDTPVAYVTFELGFAARF